MLTNTKTQVPFKHKKLRDIEAELLLVQKCNFELLKAQTKEEGHIKVRCLSNHRFGQGCGKSTKIRDLAYIRTHLYIPPSGCSSGDYYREDEGQFICPHCGHRNRLYDRPDYQQLKNSFGSIVDDYGRE